MSFDIEKLKPRRFAFTIFEMLLDINDPSLDVELSQDQESCGTPKTTNDARAYTGIDFRSYRYSDQSIFGVQHFPYLVSATSNAPTVDPGNSIGFRASGNVTINDFVTDDSYEIQSPYFPRITGSHFTKLFARNHLKNRRARIIRGYNPNSYDEDNTQIENYLIDSWSLPDKNGLVSINLVDELILAQSKKAKAPIKSRGVLSATIDSSVTTLSFSTTITEEYGAISSTGYIAIGKEIMSYTVATTTTMNVVRGRLNTEAASHEANETIQLVIYYDDQNIIDIITDLISNYTRIPLSYIPTSKWNALKSGDLADYNLTRPIYKPEGVNKLLNELVTLAGLSMYVDVIDSELVIVTVPDFASPVIEFNDSENIERDTIKVNFNFKKQITRQSILWDKKDPTETDDEQNYRKGLLIVDDVTESPVNGDTVSEGKEVKSNWLINSIEDNSLASNYANRMVNRFSKTPISVSFETDQAYIGSVSGGRMWLGSIFNLRTYKLKDKLLNEEVLTCQCTSIKESRDKYIVSGFSYVSAIPPIADFFIDSDKTDYVLADDPEFSPILSAAREYVVVINSGVKIGGSSNSVSFDQGVFPVGATLRIINLGIVAGRGGFGGNGGDSSNIGPNCVIGAAPTNGGDGGSAFSFTTDATLDNGFGFIFAGGGGGGGHNGQCNQPNPPLWDSIGGDAGGAGRGLNGANSGTPGTGSTQNGIGYTDSTINYSTGGGGDFGQPGDNNDAVGGSGGNAILKNGNSLIITSGNNSEQIIGPVT